MLDTGICKGDVRLKAEHDREEFEDDRRKNNSCSAEELEQYCFLDKGTLAIKNDSKIIALKGKVL